MIDENTLVVPAPTTYTAQPSPSSSSASQIGSLGLLSLQQLLELVQALKQLAPEGFIPMQQCVQLLMAMGARGGSVHLNSSQGIGHFILYIVGITPVELA